MAPTKTMISALTSLTKNAALHVHVTRIWESIYSTKKTIFHTNVVFFDEEGSHVAAKIWNNQKDTYFPLLAEGLVYTISNLIVVPTGKEYRPVNTDWTITFYYNTKVKPVADIESIPKYKFDLTGFDSVADLLWKVNNFIEVIGMVEAIGNTEYTSKGAQKMDIRLVDERDQRMIVTLWEERVTQFRESLAAASNGRAAFVVITGLLAKKYSLATVILSSGDGTTTYCNIDYGPLNDLKAAVLVATGHTSDTLPPPATARLMSATADATKEKTIQEILESDLPKGDEVIRVLCEATIMSISKYDDWFYNSCPNCPCRIQFDGDKLSCRLCPGPIDKYRQSYRVNVRVQDATARTTFTLFNKEVERLVGVPIEKVIGEIGQDKIGPEVPPILNNMVAKKCLFEVKIISYNTSGHDCYTIARLSETQSTPTPSVLEPGKLPEDFPETSNKGATESSKKQRIS